MATDAENIATIIAKLDAVLENQRKQNSTLVRHEERIQELEKADISSEARIQSCERAVAAPMRTLKIWGSILAVVMVGFEILGYLK